MSSPSLQLPTTLVNAIRGFDFDGKPLWRISQQHSHVKIEITYTLNDADQPTNQPARAVRDSKPARRRRRRPRPVPTKQPTRQAPPPENITVEMPAPPTIQLQQPMTTVLTSPAPNVRQRPMIASTPKEDVHEPMEQACAAEIAFSELPAPKLRKDILDGMISADHILNYDFKRVFETTITTPVNIIEGQRKQRPHEDINVDLPVYFAKWQMEKGRNLWLVFKGPTSKRYIPEWWDYLNQLAITADPMPTKEAKKKIQQLVAVYRKRDGDLMRTGKIPAT